MKYTVEIDNNGLPFDYHRACLSAWNQATFWFNSIISPLCSKGQHSNTNASMLEITHEIDNKPI
jgi:hypothetical protein